MYLSRSIAFALVITVGLLRNLQAAEHTKDSLDVVKKALAEKKAVIVDVRDKDEWNDGHLKDAIHLPLSKIHKGITAEELTKLVGDDKIIYLHCKAGIRSLDAANRLAKTKRDLRALKPGYDDLLKAGFEKAK